MEFIIHIGAAKTGTTTIQNHLEKSSTLHDHGAVYLGLMLEHAPAVYEWQDKKKISAFHHLDTSEFGEQVSDVMIAAAETYAKQGVKQLIWSNEMLFKYSDKLLPVISQLLDKQHTVRVIGYIRNHISWARSAYEQFSLFSKTYPGKTRSFSEYFQSRPVNFSRQIKPLATAYPEVLTLKSLDNVPELITDFYAFAGIDVTEGATHKNDNQARSLEELLFRICYNDTSDRSVSAREFNENFNSSVNFRQSPQQYLSALLPNEEKLNALQDMVDEDCQALSELVNNLEAPRSVTPNKPEAPVSLNNDILIFNLLKIVMQQQRQISALESKVSEQS